MEFKQFAERVTSYVVPRMSELIETPVADADVHERAYRILETAEHEFRNSKKHCLVMKERYNETQRQLELLRETKSAHAFVERSNNIE